MRNIVGVLASLVTRSNSTCPKKNFKERSTLILKHSVSTTTRDPFRRPSRTILGLPIGGGCIEISSRKSNVYVLARKYVVTSVFDQDGINTLL